MLDPHTTPTYPRLSGYLRSGFSSVFFKCVSARFSVTGSFTGLEMVKGKLAFDHFKDEGPHHLMQPVRSSAHALAYPIL